MSQQNLDVRVRLLDARLAQLEAKKTSRAISGIGSSAKQAGRESREGFGVIGNSARSLIGAFGLGGLAIGLKDAVQGGMGLQAQQAQLQQALKATGQAGGNAYKSMLDQAEKLATHGGFGTPENLQALTAFTRETHSATRAQSLLNLSTNIARGRNMDLSSAQQIVAQAYTGNVGRLQKLLGPLVASKAATFGLTQAHKEQVATLEQQSKAMGKAGPAWLRQEEIIDGITPKMQALATLQNKSATAQQVIAAAQTAFGGATGAFDKTTAGKLSDFKNQLQDLQDTIGEKLLPVVNKLAKYGTEVLSAFTQLPGPLQGAIAGFLLLGPLLAPVLGSFRAIKSLGGGFRSGISGLKSLFGFGSSGAAKTAETHATDNLGRLAFAAKGAADALALISGEKALGAAGGGGLGGDVKAAEEGGVISKILSKVPGGKGLLGLGEKFGLKGLTKFAGPAGLIAMGLGTAINHIKPLHDLAKHIPLLNSVASFVGFSHGGPVYRAAGGPSGTDTQPAWLTPGEYVLDQATTNRIGIGGLQQLQAGGGLGNQNIHITIEPADVRMDSRVVAQLVLKAALNRAARGSSSLVGGSLATVGGYTSLATGSPF